MIEHYCNQCMCPAGTRGCEHKKQEDAYFDIQGNPVELLKLVRDESEWAANVIRSLKQKRDTLTAVNGHMADKLTRIAMMLPHNHDADEILHIAMEQLPSDKQTEIKPRSCKHCGNDQCTFHNPICATAMDEHIRARQNGMPSSRRHG